MQDVVYERPLTIWLELSVAEVLDRIGFKITCETIYFVILNLMYFEIFYLNNICTKYERAIQIT